MSSRQKCVSVIRTIQLKKITPKRFTSAKVSSAYAESTSLAVRTDPMSRPEVERYVNMDLSGMGVGSIPESQQIPKSWILKYA